MKILVSAFDAFAGEKINPSYEVLKLLPDFIGKNQVIKLQIPTVYSKAPLNFINKLIEAKPDYAFSLGQAGGRSAVTIERVAINIDDSSTKDNEGEIRNDYIIDEEGPSAYFSTLPVKDLVKSVKDIGVPCSLSNTAGTFVCNHVMYSVLNYITKNNLKTKYGFIHIPYMHEQVLEKNSVSSMSLETMVKAIREIISKLPPI